MPVSAPLGKEVWHLAAGKESSSSTIFSMPAYPKKSGREADLINYIPAPGPMAKHSWFFVRNLWRVLPD